MKQILLSILLLLLPLIAWADDSGTCGANLTWTYNETTKTLTISGSGEMENYSLSSAPWYNYRQNILNAIVEKGVTSIGSYAFRYCSSLTSVTIPNSVTSIGDDAFYDCYGLTSVIISDITAWFRIVFNTSRSNPLCFAKHLFLNNNEISNLIIPDGVTSIGNYALYCCSSLTSVTIPNSVTTIGDDAFYECSGLTSVNIPNSVTSIGDYAFYGCSGLTSVIIGSNVSIIGNGAFNGCSSLSTIYSFNPIPPRCINPTFISSTSGSYSVRDKYDVYTYAILHVPMGSGESYSSAYEWRYFNRIKEDMESNGKIYYANLTVQQGTTGYTRQPVKAAETYTIYIGSLGDNKVNAVTFNGVDVTNSVVNGYYTTPEIKGESVLSVTYETTTSKMSSPSMHNIRVTGYNGEINVDNIEMSSDVTAYTIDGKIVGSIPSAIGSAKIQVPTEQLYIVKVGNRTFKLAM